MPKPVPGREPNITIALSAYNEERFIEAAIRSVYSSDYPADKITLLVGSDGSDDRTDEIVRTLAGEFPGISFKRYGRSGKNQVLNNLLKDNSDEYIFYMDADCRLEKDTILKMVEMLGNGSVGAVIAAMHSLYADATAEESGSRGEGLYQKYETAMKINESKVHSTAASCGLFYGTKAEYYRPLPNTDVCDDLYPLMVIARHKKRVVYMKDAVAYEYREKSSGNEFKRRIRIIAGAYATIAACKYVLSPFFGMYGFAYFSHKVLRYLASFFILGVLLLTPFAYGNIIFWPLAVIQVLFYGTAFIGRMSESLKINLPFARIFYYFVLQNIAVFLGFFRFLTTKNISRWNNQ